ncbi:MAG: hypothetical protein M3003_00890 [Candidatus Dormibacteraeota bacterium]|nr:hypothetical protein [Candidatus Dormibacteraeota bacterium]
MAEGTIQLPADGAGKALRTITNPGVAAGAHQEVTTLAGGDGTLADIAPTGIKARDDFQTGECLADQTGAGAVLTFTFAAPRNLVLIEAVGTGTQVARADPFGGTPNVTTGIRCDDGVPTYVPVTTTTLRVWAPASMAVAVAGFSRA